MHSIELCPNIADELCTNVDSSAQQCNFTQVPYGDELEALFQFFNNGTLDSILDGLGDLEGDLYEWESLLDKANLFYPKHATWVFWTAAGTCLLLGLIAMVMVGAMFYLERNGDFPDRFRWLRSWFVVPLMILLVSVSWILAMAFILLGLGSSDFCYNSPDEPVLNLLESVQAEFSSVLYPFLRYYVSGCPAVEAPRSIEGAVVYVQDFVLPALGNLANAIQSQEDGNMDELCGTDSTSFLAILSALGVQLCILAHSLVSYFSCGGDCCYCCCVSFTQWIDGKIHLHFVCL